MPPRKKAPPKAPLASPPPGRPSISRPLGFWPGFFTGAAVTGLLVFLGFLGLRAWETSEPEGLRLALVIDDVGNNLEELQAWLEFPEPVTLAVLPFLPHSQAAAQQGRRYGKEVILHMPMEADSGQNPGPGTIELTHSPEEASELFLKAWDSLAPLKGMNNHMGSRVTQDASLMRAVLGALKTRGGGFLDSVTSPKTLGASVARDLGVPWTQRLGFLDNQRDPESLKAAWQSAVHQVQSLGHGVFIGHAGTPGLASLIQEDLPRLKSLGIRLIFLSQEWKGGSHAGPRN